MALVMAADSNHSVPSELGVLQKTRHHDDSVSLANHYWLHLLLMMTAAHRPPTDLLFPLEFGWKRSRSSRCAIGRGSDRCRHACTS